MRWHSNYYNVIFVMMWLFYEKCISYIIILERAVFDDMVSSLENIPPPLKILN